MEGLDIRSGQELLTLIFPIKTIYIDVLHFLE